MAIALRTKKLFLVELDDDTDQILSVLNVKKVSSMMIDETTKRTLSNQDPQNDIQATSNNKRSKSNLTCIVCTGPASGYNFNRISCNSCKEFFRRNASRALKLKCLNGANRSACNIQFDMKQKCPRCRLKKCLELGMRKDFILTREAKDLRQQCIEENRRLRSTPITNSNLTTTSSALPCLLTEADQACLADLQRVHLLSRQSSPSASSIFSFELLPDPESAFIHTMNLENLYALQMINFLRSVSDFASLDERDRLTLVKYNLNSLFYVQASLTYDPTNGICYFEHVSETPSSSETAFAHQCERLYSLCYGDAALQRFTSVIHALHEILACDSTSAQLLMLMMIFLKGWSLDEDQAPILIDGKRVFQAQSKYTDLFFRYLLSKFPVETAAMKMTRVLDQMLKMQSISQDYDPYIKSKAQTAHINPLMKSLLHLS